MIGFLIKKAFFDLWDNLFRIILINLGFLIILALAAGIFFGISLLIPATLITKFPLVHMGIFLSIALIDTMLLMVYLGAASNVTKAIVDYETPGFKDFFKHLKLTYKTSLLFGLINFIILAVIAVATDYYLDVFKNVFGVILVFFIIGMYFYWFVAAFYFFPLQSRFGPALKKNIKKSFILFFDNTAFSIFALLLTSLVIIVLSLLPPIVLLIGPAGLLLWGNCGLKLRLLKYDYLEEHADANRKKIPWDVLLLKEKEKVGKRTLKGLLFPWKE
jgi:uncharacterized membrane protein YesL